MKRYSGKPVKTCLRQAGAQIIKEKLKLKAENSSA